MIRTAKYPLIALVVDVRGPWPVLIIGRSQAIELIGLPRNVTAHEALTHFHTTRREPPIPHRHGDQ